MFGSEVLDVAIGLILVYLLLSLFATAVREAVESVFKTRAVFLEAGIRELLDDRLGRGLAKEFYEHPLIYSLYKGPYHPGKENEEAIAETQARERMTGANLPTYIPAKSFSTALVDLVVRGPATAEDSDLQRETITLDSLRTGIALIGSAHVRRALLIAVDDAKGDLDKAKANIEGWFDASMTRVSGWYKRRTHYWLSLIHIFFPESAARALNALNRQREGEEREAASITPRLVDRAAAAAILQGAHEEKRDQLTQAESIALLESYGIPVAWVHFVAAGDASAPEAAATAVGYPLVMKLASPDITHKTDVGGVVVGIHALDELREAYATMMARVRAAAPDARVDGVVLQRMIPGGRETIAGVTHDPRFGPLLMFGLGGIFVEALEDVIFRVAPVDDGQARDMVRGIRGARVLQGLRGEAPADEAAIVDALCRLGQLAADFPEIAELDVNPLLALASGVVAVDARVRVQRL